MSYFSISWSHETDAQISPPSDSESARDIFCCGDICSHSYITRPSRVDEARDRVDTRTYHDARKLELSRRISLCLHWEPASHRDGTSWDECHDTCRRILVKYALCSDGTVSDDRCDDRKLYRILDRKMVGTRYHPRLRRLVWHLTYRGKNPRGADREKWLLVYRPGEIS